MNNYRITLLCLITVALGQFSCAPVTTAGGSSSTDNGKILGKISLGNGQPAPKVQVALLPSDNDPFRDSAAIRLDTTDMAGDYAFSNLAPGYYTIEAVSINDRTRALVSSIFVDSTATNAPGASVLKPGALRIKVPSDSTASIRYVYLPGTSLYGIVQNGFGFIDSVPAGTIPVICYVNPDSSIRSRVIMTDVTLVSGDTLVIADNSAWVHSKRLFLNTTASGADISGAVFNFPVLVRLSGADFDFSQARPDGGDLRFRKSDDTPLSYEIERWDPVAGHAEVWVKMDTVYGNDSAQFFTMNWGNPNAANESSASAVFDTAAGFQGVWHLGDDAQDSIRDATVNHYHGISPDSARPSIAEGMIGNCRKFDGKAEFITMPNTAAGKLNFQESGYYTVCAWVLLDTFDNASHCIVSKGYEQYYLRSTYFPSNSPLWEFVEFDETKKWQTSTLPATSGQWTFLAGIRQGTSQFLYCNGVLIDSITGWPQAQAVSRNTSNDLFIGRFKEFVNFPIANDGYCFFKGSIDEVRILSAAQSQDWVRLSYMNQRNDDRLVRFK